VTPAPVFLFILFENTMEKKKQLETMGKRKRGQLPFLFKKKKMHGA